MNMTTKDQGVTCFSEETEDNLQFIKKVIDGLICVSKERRSFLNE